LLGWPAVSAPNSSRQAFLSSRSASNLAW
jgi:hypothetical protein